MARLQMRGDRTGLYITDYEDLLREMRRIQPTLVKRMQDDFTKIAKPVQKDVQQAIPISPPTSGIHRNRPRSPASGFYPRVVPGRLTWGSNHQNKNIPVRSVRIEKPSASKARRSMSKNKVDVMSIARLRVGNAAVVMADMAGKTGQWINRRRVTREYEYSRSRSGVRKHRVNNQGRAMIRALNRNPSRFVWPAADKSKPLVNAQAKMVLEKAYASINRKLSS